MCVWRLVANKMYQGGRQSHAKIACDWRPVAFKLNPSGRQSHAIIPAWPPVAGKFPFSLACGHTGTICMPLAATGVQFICNWWPLGYDLNATGHQLRAKPPVF